MAELVFNICLILTIDTVNILMCLGIQMDDILHLTNIIACLLGFWHSARHPMERMALLSSCAPLSVQETDVSTNGYNAVRKLLSEVCAKCFQELSPINLQLALVWVFRKCFSVKFCTLFPLKKCNSGPSNNTKMKYVFSSFYILTSTYEEGQQGCWIFQDSLV